MEWHKDLYAGESVLQKQKKIKWKIRHNKLQLWVYVITLAANKENLLDIIPSRELLQKHYPKRGLYIIGLAGNYQEALELAGHIVSEVYRETGGFDIRSYICQNGKQML
ncbi:MAG: hypothetical protein HFJ04_13105 [Lachnospiraceae bacterium]|nr:hypothetical protein [Lachnospiraceae bacterium]